MRRTRRQLAHIGVVFLVAFCGCLPDDIVWLPNSSGFVFSSPKSSNFAKGDNIRSIFHYDVRKKTLHILVPRGAMHGTTRPGVSPDGTRVAVAQVWARADELFLHVHTVDLNGAVDVWSKPYRITSPVIAIAGEFRQRADREGAFQVQAAAVDWSDDGRRLLVEHNWGCAQYDLTTRTFREYSACPSPFLAVRPLLPDGSGFLAILPEAMPAEGEAAVPAPPDPGAIAELAQFGKLATVSWDGDVHRLRLDPKVVAEFKNLEKAAQQEFANGRPARPYQSRRGAWRNGIASVPLRRGNVLINPKAMTVTYQDDPAVARLWDWADRSNVQFVETFEHGQATIGLRDRAVAFHDAQTGWKILARDVHEAEFFPSPHGELMAARCRLGNGVFRVIVIDRNGNRIGEFDAL